MKAFKMACLQYKPSPVTFEQASYTRDQLIGAKNSLLKYALSQLKHLDLGVIDKDAALLCPQGLGNAWNNIQSNQDMEKGNYAELDPALLPAWPGSKQNSPNSIYSRKNTKDWLNQDSIESLKQASGGYSMQPTYAKRIEPARLSMPRNAYNSGAVTQRGRNGKLVDSQNSNINQQSSPHGKLLGQKNQLRQTMS